MLMRGLLVAGVLLVVSTWSFPQNNFPDHCSDGRPLPFAAIAVRHPIDNTCGIQGKPTSSGPSHVQNSAKNNFCATGTPRVVTPQDLINLQGQTHIATGQNQEPADRSVLKAKGEGTLVRMKANLIEAHFADLGSGESVNCGTPPNSSEQENDIHIALGPAANTEECSSVSGEISPHFRPASWSAIGLFEQFDKATNKNIVNPQIASRLQAHPYRFTGQLFFDASHAPCPCGTGCNPSRSSDWEIHPIYNIEVCKAGTPCNVNSDADWIPFDTWWKSLAPIQPVRPPHSHEPFEPAPGPGGGVR